MTRNEFETIKRNIITLAEQIKITGEIPKPFERKKYYDSEKQRVFLVGISYGLSIALNIFAAKVAPDEIYKAKYYSIFEKFAPDLECAEKDLK